MAFKEIICAVLACTMMIDPMMNIVQAEDHKKDLKIINSGYSVEKSSISKDVYIQYCAIVKNENTSKTIEWPTIKTVAKDTDGRILGVAEQNGGYLAPGDTTAIHGELFVGTSSPDSVDIETRKPNFVTQKTADSDDFKIYKVKEKHSETGNDQITGILEYTGSLTIPEVEITAVYKKKKKIVFADDTTLTDIDNQLDTFFEIDPTASTIPEHDSIDLYIQQTKLSE